MENHTSFFLFSPLDSYENRRDSRGVWITRSRRLSQSVDCGVYSIINDCSSNRRRVLCCFFYLRRTLKPESAHDRVIIRKITKKKSPSLPSNYRVVFHTRARLCNSQTFQSVIEKSFSRPVPGGRIYESVCSFF